MEIVEKRRGSFELFSDDEIDDMDSETTLFSLLETLREYFDSNISLEAFDEIFNESKEHHNQDIYRIPLIANIRAKHTECCERLKNIKDLMLSKLDNSIPTPANNWDAISKNFNVDQYLVFIYCLIRLIDFNFSDKVNQNLSFAAGRTYIVLLSSPGAKRCRVFDPDYVIKILKMFDLLPVTYKHSDVWNFQYLSMMEEFEIVFKLVGLNDQEDVKKNYIDTIKKILEHNLNIPYTKPVIYEMLMKSYRLLDVLCLPIHGDIEENVYMIFCRTFDLHYIQPKRRNFQSESEIKHEENIWNYFIYLIDCYPETTKNVLLRFIKSLLSNPDPSFGKNLGRLIDIAVKYELAILWKLNDTSVLDYLKKIVYSSDAKHRANAIEFLGKMVLVDSTMETSKDLPNLQPEIPREVEILTILFKFIGDKVDTVKLKALNAIKVAFESGNEVTKKILRASLKRKDPDDSISSTNSGATEKRLSLERRNLEKSLNIGDDQENQENEQVVNPEKEGETTESQENAPMDQEPTPPPPSLPKKTKPEDLLIPFEVVMNFKNGLLILIQTCKQVYPKKCSIELLETVGNFDEELVNDDYFIEIMSNIADDPSQMVKSAGIETMNNFLRKYPQNYQLIEIWVDLILCLLKDDDTKVVDAAIKSLIENLFNKVVAFEDCTTEENYMPWLIMRAILKKGKRNVVIKSLSTSMQADWLTKRQLEKIETNIFSANKTEGWALLTLICRNIKSNKTEFVLKNLLDLIQSNQFDNVNMNLILEIVNAWIDQFSKPAIAQIVAHFGEILKAGNSNITMIQYFYALCKMARKRMFPGQPEKISDFIKDLNETAKNFLIANIMSFHNGTNDEKFLNFMMIYGETTTDLPSRPDKKILDYFFGYLKSAVDGKISFSFQLDTPRKINLTVTLLTRFAIRDYELAASLSPFLGKLLCQKIPITIIENVMLSLNNLCKKHTATVEPIMKDIVYQLKSPNDEIRICALENLYDLILQDYIKLRGQVLLHILASLVDKNENVTLKATALILNYAYDKNQNLLHTCFIESVFVLNGYFQFEDFGVFPASELDNKSTILMGEHKRDYRYELYDFFCKNIHEMNEVHLLMLFKYVLTILEKFKKKKLVKNRYGVQAFQDLLHCFKLICEKREESRSKIEKTSDNADDDDMDDDLPVEQVIEAAVAKKSTKINKNLPTMKDAIQLIEKVILVYPQFYDCMKSYDKSLEPGLNLLSLAIAKNFKNLVQYAKPADFWDQFRKKTAGPSTRKRPRRKSKDSQVADDLDLD